MIRVKGPPCAVEARMPQSSSGSWILYLNQRLNKTSFMYTVSTVIEIELYHRKSLLCNFAQYNKVLPQPTLIYMQLS